MLLARSHYSLSFADDFDMTSLDRFVQFHSFMDLRVLSMALKLQHQSGPT